MRSSRKLIAYDYLCTTRVVGLLQRTSSHTKQLTNKRNQSLYKLYIQHPYLYIRYNLTFTIILRRTNFPSKTQSYLPYIQGVSTSALVFNTKQILNFSNSGLKVTLPTIIQQIVQVMTSTPRYLASFVYFKSCMPMAYYRQKVDNSKQATS